MTLSSTQRARRSRRGRLLGIVSSAAIGLMGLTVLPTATASVPMSVTSTSTTKAAPDATTPLAGLAVTGADPAQTLQITVATDLGTIGISGHSGLSLAYANNWSGDSSVTFSGLPADINAALTTASLSVAGSVGATAHVSMTALVSSPGLVYSPSNQHFYEYVEAQDITWNSADPAARARTFGGQSGYLATIPNDGVNDLISERIEGATNVWIGAVADQTPDEPVARTWKWAAGPLAGSVISKCSNYEEVCDFIDNSGLYSRWADGEPNNSGASRVGSSDPECSEWWFYYEEMPSHCFGGNDWDLATGESVAVTNWGGVVGRWNDLPPGVDWGASGYVVEYGDLPVGATSFTGVASDTSDVAIVSVPGAPTAVTTDPDDGRVTVSWAAPADNGSPITGYTVLAMPANRTCTTATTTSCAVTGLPNGTEQTFHVVAENEEGPSAPSAPAYATPRAAPDAPTQVSGVRGDQSATVSFTAPDDHGGAEVTGYTITTQPGGATSSCSSSPCVVSGLTNGEEYTFTVAATNVAGPSVDSDPSNVVVPAGVPTLPGNGTVVASHGNGSAQLTFTASAGNGSPVTAYTVTTHPGGATSSCPGSPCTVSGLTNGVEHWFSVVAVNDVGDSAPAESDSVTPATVPTAPRDLSVTRGDRQLQLTFTVPASDGGSVITGYQYTLDGTTWHALPTSGTGPLAATLGELGNGTDYEVGVRAVNAEGHSPASEPGHGTPAARPGAPAVLSATRGDQQVTVAFTAPAENGEPVTGYTVTASPGDVTQSCSTSPCTVTGLTNGTVYTFTVVATNAVGTSDPSALSEAATPASVPAAPRHLVATSHDSAVGLAFDPPLHDGGADVSAYEVSLDEGTTWHPLTVTGEQHLTASVANLDNGTTVRVSVRALNDVGHGPGSEPPVDVTPAGAPSAPQDVTRKLEGTSAVVSWDPPSSDGGMPVVGYTVTATPGDGSCSTQGSTTCTVEGLVAGESYTFTVRASNLAAGHHGTGQGPGAASAPLTVTAQPGAPTQLMVTGGDRTLSLAWHTPQNVGSSQISSYQVSIDGGATWREVSTTGTSPVGALVTRVLNGTTYAVAVRAVNAAGVGKASASALVTPRTWFADPLTTLQRQHLVPVPRNPERYHGPRRWTRAKARSHDGTPAMAGRSLKGRRMQPGQAVHLGQGSLFEFDRAVLSRSGREQLKAAVDSLGWVEAVTCEGYADYGGRDRRERELSASRARVVCRALRAYGADVRTTVRAYGNDVPVVVSGTRFPDRAPNRRVILVVTR